MRLIIVFLCSQIKLLMNQAFGSPLQRLPAVGVDSSDSDSVASTPDDGGSGGGPGGAQAPHHGAPAPPLPTAKPPSRSSAPNSNNVKEIRSKLLSTTMRSASQLLS